MIHRLLYILINIHLIQYANAAHLCKDISDKENPVYSMTATCQRSTLKTLKIIEYDSFNECQSLAIRIRGMAFSFSPMDRRYEYNEENELKSCMVYACPEVENSTSLVFDDRFDYYSIFANPIPPPNSSCVEGIGIFVYHLFTANYTTAKESCEEFGGHLPDIATEERTNQLSDLLSLTNNFKYGQFYVGLDDLDTRGRFFRSNGELLTCTSYRAWAPGHPRSKGEERCVTLDSNRMWKTVACDKKMYFICEIYPGKWNIYQDGIENDGCLVEY